MAQNFLFHRPNITKRELVSVLDCMISDELSFGNIVLKYEKSMQETFHFEKVFCCPSISSAYHLALLSLEIKEGDEIILSSMSHISILDAIHYVKATPIIIDLQTNSLHIDIKEVCQKITKDTKVIILDYPYGSYYDFKPFIQKLKNNNLLSQESSTISGDTKIQNSDIPTKNIKVIKDVSYLFHTYLYENNYYDTNLPDFTIVGLNQTMNMTIGKGALLGTSLKKNISNIQILRNQEKELNKYCTRYDYTITDYQAAIGIEQLNHLELTNKRIQSIANLYLQNIQKNSYIQSLFFQRGKDQYGGGFPILFQSELSNVESTLKKNNIPYQRLLPHRPLHHYLEPELNLNLNRYQNIQKLYEKSIVLPIYANLRKKEIEQVAKILIKIT